MIERDFIYNLNLFHEKKLNTNKKILVVVSYVLMLKSVVEKKLAINWELIQLMKQWKRISNIMK